MSSHRVILSTYDVLGKILDLIGEIIEAQNEPFTGKKKQVMDQSFQRVMAYKRKFEKLFHLLYETFEPHEGLEEISEQSI